MNQIKTILFYYNLVFIFCLLAIGVYTSNVLSSPTLLIIVFPLVLYFYGYLFLNSKRFTTPTNQYFWIFVSLLMIFNIFSTSILFISSVSFAHSLTDVLISILYLPLPLYFFTTIVGWYRKITENNQAQPKITKVKSNVTAVSPVSSTNVDLDRRRFLKILGGTGISIFLMSLLNPKQAGAAFFGSVPGPGTISIKDASGIKINPAEKQPTDGYKISQIDDTNYPYYYGYVNSTGAWYIMSEDVDSNYRYTKGDSGFAANWTIRASLTYGYFDSIF